MSDHQIKEELLALLSRTFRIKSINDDENIFETGIVHSLFFMQLLIFIEKKFQIEFEGDDFDIHKLNTIGKITSLIKRKLKESV